jgi:hypothetical protein
MAYHIEKMDARFGRKVYYSGNNQWSSKFDYRLIFENEKSANMEHFNVRGTIVEE